MLHVLERSKVLGTACLGVIILKKSLRPTQWSALVLIVVGVLLSQNHTETRLQGMQPDVILGTVAALGVSLVSSFSGVYLELMIKSDRTSLALRNVQLAIFSIPLQIITICYVGQTLFVELCWKSWVLALNLAFAGLLVAAVMRFADNNLKNLAQSLATIVSALVSIPLFGFQPSACSASQRMNCAEISPATSCSAVSTGTSDFAMRFKPSTISRTLAFSPLPTLYAFPRSSGARSKRSRSA